VGCDVIGHVERGGVYIARTLQGGERPVVVISADSVTRALRKPVVCEITSTARERNLPTVVPLLAGEAGLDRDSFALCHEIGTVGIEWFRDELGMLTAERVEEIDRALAVALDLPA
jgi:mRNA interferase MazF